ncbi:xaa-Pro aminopeptidase 2-like [Ambystoma mexicanum]|uniref:xaa-Pro aminopeptidase 2-like n=1 Tax=Ambystoma mexicanum TaxID=8296 RepID=UPI0037E85DAF
MASRGTAQLCCSLLPIVILMGGTLGLSKSGEEMRNCKLNPPYLPSTVINTTDRLSDLRQQMTRFSIRAYIIPATDAHLGTRDGRRAWMSGFTGSAGSAVVTMTKAALWTDSRYWDQAERQMDCNWELHKIFTVSSTAEWILNEIRPGEDIGIDPFLFSIESWEGYSTELAGTGRKLVSIATNLVDLIWKEKRPTPTSRIYQLQDDYIGRTWQEKVSEIRNQMKSHSKKPTAVLLSALDETAWLFNLRGKDIPYNPYFYAYSLLGMDFIRLFINESRITPEIHSYLNTNCTKPLCVQLVDYSRVRDNVRDYSKANVKVWIGKEYTTYGLYEVIPKEKLLTDKYSPVMMTKAVKNAKEQELMRKAHVRDAVAVIQYLVWLEKNVPKGTVDERSGARYVDGLRMKQKNCDGPSFDTISASGLNAALPHYRPSDAVNRKLSMDKIYLVDSGGQYMEGTTDITRTVHWGTPTDFEKDTYTRVLIGNIALTTLVFPSGSSGINLESFARRALWQAGLDFGHGTGHGIGNFLAVHEWPVGFKSNNIPMTKGMFTSIEPGYYHVGHFGIRIEDVVLVVEAQTQHIFGGQPYLTFQPVSLVPYDRKLINESMISDEQIEYLDRHYRTIRDIMGPELKSQSLEEEHEWLMRHTEPFSQATLTVASVATLIGSFLVSMLL